MNKENDLSKFIPVLIIVTAVAIMYYLPKLIRQKNSIEDSKNYIIEKSKYSANEYIPILVSDEQMARKYILDYLNQVHYNIRTSYYLLDNNYRNEVFGNIDKYIEYVNTYNFTYELQKYSVYNKGKYKYYDLYDKNGNHIIFKTQGVMQYSVLFDKNIEMGV